MARRTTNPQLGEARSLGWLPGVVAGLGLKGEGLSSQRGDLPRCGDLSPQDGGNKWGALIPVPGAVIPAEEGRSLGASRALANAPAHESPRSPQEVKAHGDVPC